MDLDLPSCEMDFVSNNFSVYSSCNGLLLICATSELYIWNPSIRKIKRLPQGLDKSYKDYLITCPAFVCVGFGFHHQKNDYKVVRIIRLQKGTYKTELYSPRLNSWRDLGVLAVFLPISLLDSIYLTLCAIHVNGAVYWKVRIEVELFKIFHIDMDNEVFNSIELREEVVGSLGCDSAIQVFENSLSVIHMRQDGDHLHVACCDMTDIWVMGLDTWKMIRKICIPLYICLCMEWPLRFTKDEAYITRLDENKEFKTLVLYDPISQEAKEIIRVEGREYCNVVGTYKESLVLFD